MPIFSRGASSQNSRGQRTANRAPIAKYYRADSQPTKESPFRKKQENKKLKRRLIIGVTDVILIAIVFFALGYTLLIKPHPAVVASDLSYRSLTVYESAAKQQFGSIKDRNKITFDETSMINNLKNQFPEISDVKVELPFFSQQPIVRLLVAPPRITLTSNGNSYIVASSGKIVGKTITLPKIKNLPSVSDQSGFVAQVGKQVLSSSSVNFISSLYAQCREAHVPVLSLTIPPAAQELDLRTNDQPYFVKFYLGGDISTQAGQFLAARAQFAKTSQTPSQYLDVRVSGKIFYK